MSNPAKPSAQAGKQARKRASERAIANKQAESSKQGTKSVRAPLVFFTLALHFFGEKSQKGQAIVCPGTRARQGQENEKHSESRPERDAMTEAVQKVRNSD